jgi:formamidopyrimidine-DNA glycosylase
MDSQETWLEVFHDLSNQFTLGDVAHLKLVLNFDVPNLFTIHTLQLDDGLEFSFTDKRRFARVRLFDDVGASQVIVKLCGNTFPYQYCTGFLTLKYCSQPETVPPISELGPDALFEPMSVDNFVESLRKKKIGIKALLLDQVIVTEWIEVLVSINFSYEMHN